MDYWYDILIKGGQPAVPLPLLMAEAKRKRLEPRHARHLLDAVDQESRARLAQHENKRSRGSRDVNMRGRVDDEERPLSSPHDLAHFSQPVRFYLRCAA